jgi:hypothetical protein
VLWQVFATWSQTKPIGQTTPPRPPHLHWPSAGSHASGASHTTFRSTQRLAEVLPHDAVTTPVTVAAKAANTTFFQRLTMTSSTK